MSSRTLILLKLLLIIIFLVISLFSVFFQPLTSDDGIYLLAGRELYSGKLPYRDFYFNQGPLLIVAYGVSQLVFPGILSGRIVAVLLGLGAMLFAGKFARAIGGQGSELLTLGLLATNPALINYQVKTYPISAFLMVLSFFFLSKVGFRWLILSSFIAVLLVFNRITTIPVMALIVGYCVFFECISYKQKLMTAATALLLILAAVSCLAMLGAIDNFIYDVIIYQRLRSDHPLFQFSWLNKILMVREIADYFFVFIVAPLLFSLVKTGTGMRTFIMHREGRLTSLGLVVCIFSISLMLFLPFSTYFGYFLDVIPLLASVTAVLLFSAIRDFSRLTRYCVLLPLIVWIILTPVRQSHDFFVNPLRNYYAQQTSPLLQTQRLGAFLKQKLAPGARILTFDPSVAVESGMTVLPGLEGGPDAYVPQWEREMCERRQVVNDEMLISFITERVPAAIVLGEADFKMLQYHTSLGHGKPLSHPAQTSMLPTIDRSFIERYYRYAGVIAGAGQWNSELYIFLQ